MMNIGFLRSKDGQRFIWKGRETEQEIIAHLHQHFQNTQFCDCELTDDVIHAMIIPQTQEDENDERVPYSNLKRSKAIHEKYKQKLKDADENGTVRNELRLPNLRGTRNADKIFTY